VIAFGIFILHFTLATATITIVAKQTPISIEKQLSIPIVTLQDKKEVKEVKPSEIDSLRESVLEIEKKYAATTQENLYPEAEIQTINLSIKHESAPQGNGTTVDAFASGTVEIFNELNLVQPLVATTRLLTPDGILFRIQNGVTVPANGSVKVVAKADKKGASGNIPPTSFTIPGLSAVRQKSVYAKNTSHFTNGTATVKTLGEDDFTRATK
jgi:hypothetical protein